MEKKCIICGKRFETKGSRKTCSDECSKENQRKKTRELNKRRVERERAARLQEMRKNPRKCPVCGKVVLRGGNATYCSSACQYENALKRSRAAYLKRKDRPTQSHPEYVVCGVCGKTFKWKDNRKYCSVECGEQARRNASKAYNARTRDRNKVLVKKMKAVQLEQRGLDAKAAEAKAAGMSYGQLVALEWMQRQKGLHYSNK